MIMIMITTMIIVALAKTRNLSEKPFHILFFWLLRNIELHAPGKLSPRIKIEKKKNFFLITLTLPSAML